MKPVQRDDTEYGVDYYTWGQVQALVRGAVIQERERAALIAEELGMIGYGTLAIAAAIRKGDQE
jgi:hypothetical protein